MRSVSYRAVRVAGCLVLVFFSAFSAPVIVQANIQGISSYYDSGVELYRAGLFVHTPGASMTSEEALASSYAMGFRILSKRLSARTWMRDLSQRAAVNNDVDLVVSSSDALIELGDLYKNPFHEGDVIILKKENDKVEMLVNDISVGAVEKAGLFELLLNSWVGSVPPSQTFKDTLLNNPVSSAEASAFEALDDVSSRQNQVTAWLEAKQAEEERLAAEAEAAQLAAQREAEAEAARLAALRQAEAEAEAAQLAAQQEEEEARRKRAAEEAAQAALASASAEAQTQEQKKVDEKQRLKELAEFRTALQVHPRRFVVYPSRSQANSEEGVVQLLVKIDRDGEVLSVEVDSSSKHSRLDRAAMSAVKDASPFPPMPDVVSGDTLEFLLPLSFRLRR